MSESTIRRKTIRDLLKDESGNRANYWIPSYQRGFRWSPLMVTQLMDDVWEFIQSPGTGTFYCLQPIVIKRDDNDRYELVDGQQRLTTIYIILKYLHDLLPHFAAEPFILTFETRSETEGAFLADIKEERAQENADFYHIWHAYQAVDRWFVGERALRKIKFLQYLLNTVELGPNVQVIWYELIKSENPIQAFTRLNVGKIPLSDDELIRALFLRRKEAGNVEALALQHKIAHEWDQIEKALRNNAFWYFLNTGQPSENRIGFLFQLVAESDGIPKGFAMAPNRIFLAFNERLSPKDVDQDGEWTRIKEYFMRLEEWYDDRLLFHMIGFLVHQNVVITTLNEIAGLSQRCTKQQFILELRKKIFASAIKSPPIPDMNREAVLQAVAERLDDLDYETSSDLSAIRSALLLFNLATLHENPNTNQRFQFDNLKKQTWNIEHIRSIASDPPETYPARIDWFELCAEYFSARQGENDVDEKTLLTDINAFKELEKDKASLQFDPLYRRVLKYFHEEADSEPDHGIGNLALLDETTNKSYKNAPFAVKRDRILARDKDGLFIPLCTRNVFLKCYNRRANDLMFWTTDDRAAYRDAMITTITNFLSGGIEHE